MVPLLAALGGVWASADGIPTDAVASLATALALVAGGWQSYWRALTTTDWATPLKAWRGWRKTMPFSRWPYLQPGTPGAALHHRIAQARAWWIEVGRLTLAQPLRRAVVALFVSLLLGAALGRFALLLTLCFAAWTQLALLWSEGDEVNSTIWAGVATAGLPWLLTSTLVSSDALSALIAALALSLMVGLYAKRSWLSLCGPIVGAAYLVWRGHGLATGWLLLLSLPGLAGLVDRPTAGQHRAATGPWILAMIALIALVV